MNANIYAYRKAMELKNQDYPFSSLIMAAMVRADSDNLIKLQRAFPGLWKELEERYWAPGGYLPGEEEQEPHQLTDDDLEDMSKEIEQPR